MSQHLGASRARAPAVGPGPVDPGSHARVARAAAAPEPRQPARPAPRSPIRAFLRSGLPRAAPAAPARAGGAASAYDDPDASYAVALELARAERYGAARDAFEALVRAHPHCCKAWVSYAQMEKRVGRNGEPERLQIARYILQRGLSSNPDSACLAQAWGLLELQRGNFWAAVRLLERCVVMEPANAPVLKWLPVRAAAKTVSGRRRRGAAVVPAAGGGGGGGGCGGAMSSCSD
ncbi:hypothetical protein Rsub_02755 [Raphidocelis subcapitata]|uniref:Uncharacterized protein n=1 Tax=Raphidocelis subcapitata TaxID=307507 RepID=A0A2V0NYP4_9CHLO|nr:hypothetical protein Rsub_02755 [Raphidocelis subcapitata]|eukprot:GBF90047.1 hypothetical protein Rsub_02755 [Raphidocelis subcapitata]